VELQLLLIKGAQVMAEVLALMDLLELQTQAAGAGAADKILLVGERGEMEDRVLLF
jgi:hypothetical protein